MLNDEDRGIVPRNLQTSTRLVAASDTLAAIRPILTEYDIHGYVDHTPSDIALIQSVEVLRGEPRSGYLNLGKGFGIEASLASGYMEAIELSTIEQAPQVPVFFACNIDPQSIIYGFAEKKSRAVALTDHSSTLGLIQGVDLLTSSQVYGLVYENFLPAEDNGDILNISTNGLASGNSIAEARLHSVYELIERHVAAASLLAMDRVTFMLLQDMPMHLRDAVAELNAVGQRTDFFQLGSMLGVPVVQCALSPFSADATRQSEVSFGWGADHSLSIALGRALAEAVQAWATRSACMRGDIPPARMRGGMLISVEQLLSLRSPPPVGLKVLHRRLLACATENVSLAAATDRLTAPAAALGQLIANAIDSGISHLYSWQLSPSHRPFSVVKCVIPEFKALF